VADVFQISDNINILSLLGRIWCYFVILLRVEIKARVRKEDQNCLVIVISLPNGYCCTIFIQFDAIDF